MTTPVDNDPIFASLTLLQGAAAADLLHSIVERCQRGAPKAIAVFDLDSTLLDNSPRQARILAEYGQQHQVDALYRSRPEHWKTWDYREAMRQAGLATDAIEAHVVPFRNFWRERFFTSEYCAVDEAVPGAVAYAGAVEATGVRLVYVTGRHELMRQGSVAAFARLGFPTPDGDRIELWMKPTLEEHDDDYKVRTHDRLQELGPVVAMFDNEPAHINDYHQKFPEAVAVHLATNHSMRPIPVHDAIRSIADFSAYPSSEPG